MRQNRMVFTLFTAILLLGVPGYGMSQTSAALLDQALAQSESDLKALRTEHAQKRQKEKAAFEDALVSNGRKTAENEKVPQIK